MLITMLFSTALALAAPADHRDGDAKPVVFTVDKAHSQISFKVRHLAITNVTGSFSDYAIELEIDPSDLSTLNATTVIDVASIDTGVERRDNHLRSDDFFDAEQFPSMTFESTSVTPRGDGQFLLAGDLTIRDTTRPVEFSGVMVGPVIGTRGEVRIGFQATAAISRSDFGLTWNRLTEAGEIIVSDDVAIVLDISAVRESEGS